MSIQNIIIDAIETAIHQMANIKINLYRSNRNEVIDIISYFIDEYTDVWQCVDDYCVIYLNSAASAQTVTITWQKR